MKKSFRRFSTLFAIATFVIVSIAFVLPSTSLFAEGWATGFQAATANGTQEAVGLCDDTEPHHVDSSDEVQIYEQDQVTQRHDGWVCIDRMTKENHKNWLAPAWIAHTEDSDLQKGLKVPRCAARCDYLNTSHTYLCEAVYVQIGGDCAIHDTASKGELLHDEEIRPTDRDLTSL